METGDLPGLFFFWIHPMRALMAAALLGCTLSVFAQQDVEDARRAIA